MNYVFHYYTIAFLAVKAGFSVKDAETLAISSQFIDDHRLTLEIDSPDNKYILNPTQNYRFWNKKVVQDIFLPFHFVPSGETAPSQRKDDKVNLYDVRPNGAIAKELLIRSLKSKNLYRIGIALHAFCDTWAHQNFTALPQEWNVLDKRFPLAPGHALAFSQPDEWETQWKDPRLKNENINNRVRFTECAGKVYRYFCLYNRKEYKKDETQVMQELQLHLDSFTKSENNQGILDMILDSNIGTYDPSLWIQQACVVPEDNEEDQDLTIKNFSKKVKKTIHHLEKKAGIGQNIAHTAKKDFLTQPLWLWYNAVEEHRKEAHQILDEKLPKWREFSVFSGEYL
jgi:hypothetical protein